MEDQSSSPQQDKPTGVPPPSSAGVMDVHRPKPTAPEPSTPPPAESEPPHEPTPPSTGEPQTPPAEPAATPVPQTPDSHHLLAAHAGKKRGPTLAIILAVGIALALAGVAAYAYMQSNKTKPEDHTNHAATQPEAEVTPDAEIDSLTSEIDQLPTTVDDSKDLPESDLTDQSLGI